jgi:type IV fimbrial biogenesis protein FimT
MGDITVGMKKSHSGFTLVELLLTLTVASIIMTLAVPAFTETMRRNRLTTQANELITALNVARSEAIKRRSNVSVCVSSDQATCTGGNWQNGWIVRNDSDNEVLRIFGPMKGSTTVAAADAAFQYTSRGFLASNAAATLTLCVTSGKPGRQIAITPTGRPHNVDPYPTC